MKRLKILVADDSEKLLSALRIQLEAQGMEVATCSDAYTALAHAQKYKPDVMVLDIRMPAGDGFSVLERMAKIPQSSRIPIIYITGDKSSQLDLKAEQLGACGLIHKPINLSALLKLIDLATDGQSCAPAKHLDGSEPSAREIAAWRGTASIPGLES